jgi:N-acetylneuraminate synthase
MNAVKIGSRIVGPGQPCFVIAEIGINHNGSLDNALRLIDAAHKAGCQAVKFQKRDVETVYTAEELATPRAVDPSIIQNALERARTQRRRVLPEEALARLAVDIGNTRNGDLKWALEFGLKEFDTIELYCRERGMVWFASAWDGLSAHFMNGFQVACHKIASACLTHKNLLERVRSNGKPVILSTGGSTMEQIHRAVYVLGTEDLIIMHCVATYPCLDTDLNLKVIKTLRGEFPGVPIGYSGHERGILPSLVAVRLGAKVLERHITLDKTMPGSDQKASLEPDEFGELVAKVRQFESGRTMLDDMLPTEVIKAVCGDGIKRVLPAEVPVMKKLRRKDTLSN